MLAFSGVLRASRARLAGASQTYRTGIQPSKGPTEKRWYDFGNPWRDDYPQWIWRSLKHSRKDKDIFAAPLRLFNSTKIYEVFLKDNRRYCMFVMGAGLVTSWMWSEMWNSCWRKINKGVSYVTNVLAFSVLMPLVQKLYNDVPYIYPEED